MKPTPGPWKIHDWNSDADHPGVTYRGENGEIEYYSAEGIERTLRIVAGTEHLKNSQTFGSFEGCHVADLKIAYDGYGEAIANARLIAAAPELLAAVEAAREWLDRYGQHAPVAFGGEQELEDQLRAAIAAATGEHAA